MVEPVRMGALWCPHCNQMHPTSELCKCEGAKAYSAMVIHNQLLSAQNHRPPTDEALRSAVEALNEVTTWYGEETKEIARQALAKIKELGK